MFRRVGVFFTISLCACVGRAEGRVSESAVESFLFEIASLQAAKDRCQKGVSRVELVFSTPHAPKLECAIFMAFDGEKLRHDCESRGEHLKPDPDSPLIGAREKDLENVNIREYRKSIGRIIRLEDRVYRSFSGGRVTIHPRDFRNSPNDIRSPLDIRCVGLPGLQVRRSFEERMDRMVDAVKNKIDGVNLESVTVIDTENGRELAVTYSGSRVSSRRMLHVGDGGAIYKATVEHKIDQGPWRLVEEVTTSWKEINSILMPSETTTVNHVVGAKQTLKFMWESVNEDVDESYFDYREWSKEREISPTIVDVRLGTPVVIEAAMKFQSTPLETAKRVPTKTITVAVIGLLCAVIFYRNRK